ncbi:hypothetical protein ACFFGH_31485 [Lysobacter korlensis]|uniref:Uncharacterized protein n=1 Tax=Lysobacter korlensis TaxID=553636 RepID=A0ABV6RZH1_9GAMM
MRRSVIGAVGTSAAVVVLGLAVAQPASATSHPVAGCGASFSLTTIGGAVQAVDWRFVDGVDVPPAGAAEDIAAVVDRNADGWVCIKQYKPNQGQDKKAGAEDYVITLISDNTARGRI